MNAKDSPIIPELEQVISVKEACQRFSYSRSQLVLLCQTGQIQARQSAYIWLIWSPSLEAYCQNRSELLRSAKPPRRRTARSVLSEDSP